MDPQTGESEKRKDVDRRIVTRPSVIPEAQFSKEITEFLETTASPMKVVRADVLTKIRAYTPLLEINTQDVKTYVVSEDRLHKVLNDLTAPYKLLPAEFEILLGKLRAKNYAIEASENAFLDLEGEIRRAEPEPILDGIRKRVEPSEAERMTSKWNWKQPLQNSDPAVFFIAAALLLVVVIVTSTVYVIKHRPVTQQAKSEVKQSNPSLPASDEIKKAIMGQQVQIDENRGAITSLDARVSRLKTELIYNTLQPSLVALETKTTGLETRVSALEKPAVVVITPPVPAAPSVTPAPRRRARTPAASKLWVDRDGYPLLTRWYTRHQLVPEKIVR